MPRLGVKRPWQVNFETIQALLILAGSVWLVRVNCYPDKAIFTCPGNNCRQYE